MTKVLNPNQEQALSNLRSWYRSSFRFFILEGRAGTGKTFLMSILKDSIPTIDPLYTAPTNEAAKQLELVLPPKSPILTTYSALGFSFDTTIEDKALIQRKEHKAIENCNTIIVDECFHPEVELLTNKGFIKVSELPEGTIRIASMDLETRKLSFDKPLSYLIKDYSGFMCKIRSDKKISFNTTVNHDQVVLQGSKVVKKPIDRILGLDRFIVSAPSGMVGLDLSWWGRLAIAFQADGSYNLYTPGTTTHTSKYSEQGYSEKTTSIQFSLTKERKINNLVKILTSLGLDYTERLDENTGKTIFRANKIPADKVSKELIDIFKLNSVSQKFAIDFINEVVKWDGHITIRNSLYYSSTVESNVDFVQAMATLAGYRTNKTIQEDSRKESYKTVYRLFIRDGETTGQFSNIKKGVKKYFYEGKVYCVTMPQGTVVTRYNGQVSISGNCSMVNEQLLDALIATQRKVLFVGHRSQLPAVKKELKTFDACESIVFQKNYPIFTLETPVRNTGTLFEFINHLEQIIYKGPRVFPALYKSSTKDLRDYISTNEGRRAFYEEEAKVINYTNAETDAWNTKIRQSIHNTTQLPPYLPGDKLVLIEPSIQAGNLDRKTECQVLNALGKDGVETLSSNSKVAIREVGRANILGVACWKLFTTAGDLLFIPMSFDDYKALKASLVLRARTISDWKARQKAFENYHRLLSCFSNVKYSYAVTTHRAQGMTIPEVWVNWRNIKTCHNVALKHKLLYVAASRVRDTLHIIG